MDKELEQFKADLLVSVRQMKTGKAARSTQTVLQPVSVARIKTGLAQADFAKLLGVSVRTLQDWEQGRRNPSGAAKTLIRVADLHPEILRDLRLA